MDSCVRCLREGSGEGGAAVVLLLDDVEGCQGGDAVFEQVVQDTALAITQGRSRAHQLHAVAVDKAPSEFRALGVTSVTDSFTDPCGWVRQPCASNSTAGLTESVSPGCNVQWRHLQQLRQLMQTLSGQATGSCCLVLDGLSTLLLRHSELEVLQLLHQLKATANICSMLLPVHRDLHSPQVLAALQSLSTACLQLQSLTGLQAQLVSQATGSSCHGQLTFSSRRAKLGRLRVDTQLYRLLPLGGVEVFAAPAGIALDARSLVQTALTSQQQTRAGPQQQQQQARAVTQQQQKPQQQGPVLPSDAQAVAAEASEVQLAKKLSSSMRLDTSEQERAAKAAVQLPYVHQGAGRAYSSGDARQYLPPAAGGYGRGAEGPQGNKLGHILYVRDSDEEHDSDEDPDDDLDV